MSACSPLFPVLNISSSSIYSTIRLSLDTQFALGPLLCIKNSVVTKTAPVPDSWCYRPAWETHSTAVMTQSSPGHYG